MEVADMPLTQADTVWFFHASVDTPSDRWLPIISTSSDPDDFDVVAAFDPEYPPSPEHARLMVSAPELLDALRRVAEVLALNGPGIFRGAVADQVRTAIAKAEGK
jgi:hypothetical protein